MNLQPILDAAKFDANGLVSAIAQDAETGRVLMLAYMNRDTLRQTLETGTMTYWSRSRQKVWVKGETSGNVQKVRAAYVDCDGDALLFEVEQVGGAACHTGHTSCFFRRIEDGGFAETEPPVFDPEAVYEK
ncbi:MAG: phosphoribosyl-AMP cyclohydrolase [Rhodothermales bacterium]|nr:phosphoribosyl-AMP cyclohydrolase [Rhodothermales bacterium]